MTWEVQTRTICNGWVNTWYYEENGVTRPETFPTREAAQAGLDEFFADLDEEIKAGYREQGDTGRDDYRIVEVASDHQPIDAFTAMRDALTWLVQECDAGTDKGLLPDGLMNAANLALERANSCVDDLALALHRAEDFIEGFRDDPAQEGIDDLLKQIRDALVKAGHAPSAEEIAALNGGLNEPGQLVQAIEDAYGPIYCGLINSLEDAIKFVCSEFSDQHEELINNTAEALWNLAKTKTGAA